MTVFVDTSAIVALLSARDAHHEEAVATWAALLRRKATLVTTDLVLAETVVLVRARAWGAETAATVFVRAACVAAGAGTGREVARARVDEQALVASRADRRPLSAGV
jgi:predicted nucleic acid-binding protein